MLTHLETGAPYETSTLDPLHLASSVDAFNCEGASCVQSGQFLTWNAVQGTPGQSVSNYIHVGGLIIYVNLRSSSRYLLMDRSLERHNLITQHSHRQVLPIGSMGSG